MIRQRNHSQTVVCHEMEIDKIYSAFNSISLIFNEAWADMRELFEPVVLNALRLRI